MQRIEWFKRKFTFDGLPLWMYPNVVERLRGVPARLEDLARSLPQEILTWSEGKWSMQEHAGHLLDLEILGMHRLDDYEAGHDTLHAADLQNRKTHEAGHNTHSIENILTRFRTERMEFVHRLDSYDEAFIQRPALHRQSEELKPDLRALPPGCHATLRHRPPARSLRDHDRARLGAVDPAHLPAADPTHHRVHAAAQRPGFVRQDAVLFLG